MATVASAMIAFLLEGSADDVDDLLDVCQRIEPSSKMFEAINCTRSKQSAYVRIEFAFDAFRIDGIFGAATAVQDFARECPAVDPLDGDPGCMLAGDERADTRSGLRAILLALEGPGSAPMR